MKCLVCKKIIWFNDDVNQCHVDCWHYKHKRDLEVWFLREDNKK